MAEPYSMVEDIEAQAWGSIQEAKQYIKDAAAMEGTRIKQGYHKPQYGRVVYKCSFAQCEFRIEVTRTLTGEAESWTCRANPREHTGHTAGTMPTISRRRPAMSQWVRQQVVSFAQISAGIMEAPGPHPDGVTGTRPIELEPLDPAGRHVHINAWWLDGSGGGYDALNTIFNRADAFADLIQHMQAHRREYERFYGRRNRDYSLEVFAALADESLPMPYDMAQFMVDFTGIALILCQLGEDEQEQEQEQHGAPTPPVPGEVSLLVPRFFPEAGASIATRCLINTEGRWVVGDWTLGGEGEGPVPLYCLPVLHPFWRSVFWEHKDQPNLVTGFTNWHMFASHDPHR